MPRLEQPSLFAGEPAVVTKLADPPRAKRRARHPESTAIAAGQQKPESAAARDRRRVEAAVRERGREGLTHHEIRDALGMELQTVCWVAGDIRKAAKVLFYPQVGWNSDKGAPVFLARRGRKVLVHVDFRDAYPPPRRFASDEIRRTA